MNPCLGRLSKCSNQNDHHFGPLPFLPNFAIEKKAYDDEAGVNKEFVLLKLSSGGGGGGRGWMDNVVIPTVPCCHLPPPPASQQWWRRLSQTSSTSSWDGTRKKCLMSWDGRQFPRPTPRYRWRFLLFIPSQDVDKDGRLPMIVIPLGIGMNRPTGIIIILTS